MRRHLVRILLSSLAAVMAVTAHAADPFQVDVRPVFDSYTPQYGVIPLFVEIHNPGPDAIGQMAISGGTLSVNYPIELPSGSTKRVATYTQAEDGSQTISIRTNHGSMNVTTPYEWAASNYSTAGFQNNNQVIALISDSAGGLGFLRTPLPKGQPNYLFPTGTRPGDAPDRPVGYSGMSIVVLGEGSERLNDRQVEALKLWTLSGGTLVFVGGASPGVLRDARWEEALPVNRLRTHNEVLRQELEWLAKEPFDEVVTVTTGTALGSTKATPAPGTGTPLVFERNFGVGKTVLLSFDPFVEPIKDYVGLHQLFSNVFSGATNSQQRLSAVSGSSTAPATVSSVAVKQVHQDPFSMKLPTAASILMVLGGYFLVVVPLNFLILRKMGKGEWAWFTAPALSLLFAGLLFQSAGSLYSATMSTSTTGLLVAQQGMDEGIFEGYSQFFVPKGGTYDLKLTNVDSVGTLLEDQRSNTGFNVNESRMEGNPTDLGSVNFPQLRLPNLAFRSFSFRQKVDVDGWYQVQRRADGRYNVSNRSPYPLQSAFLWDGFRRTDIGDLKPGTSKVVASPSVEVKPDVRQNDVASLIGPSDRLALTGQIMEFRPGPQLGKEIADRRSIRLTYFADGGAQ